LSHILNYDSYQSPKDIRQIEYKRFCVEIESIFSDNQLEKNPLIEPEKYALIKNVARNKLSPDAEDLVKKSLKAISDRVSRNRLSGFENANHNSASFQRKVRRQRIQLFPRFEDFDRVRNGFVTKSQFRRVLVDLDLESLLNELECKTLCEKFCVQIGNRDDIDYNTFCDTVYEIGGFEYRRP
jgi:hypothetical protein